MLDKNSEIKENYVSFKEWLPSLIIKYGYGKFVLIRNKELVSVFDTKEDAIKAAQLAFNDGIFSIQEIDDVNVNLGFYSGCHQ